MHRRQMIAFSLLSLGGLAAISAEPINRNSRYNYQLSTDCRSNYSSDCGASNTINSIVTANNNSAVFKNDEEQVLSNGENTYIEEGRGKKKKGYGKMFMMMAGVAKATLLYAMIHVVGALATKALIVAKVALAIATAVALKKALEHPEKTSYEIVKHPHHSYINTHSTSVDYDHHGSPDDTGGYRRRRRRRAR
ncbi:uncharacterized protein LOC127286990 [Leptopilina boulardi]|uniref:uncharacterized protein LOC127286990 n=1 Tax=Leptopilina boulardi TaxID=63433 RepID=UPI0021F67A6D|nr:uncharacterized protein LOC127286990 [Leptopilina boulardi]